MSSDNSSFDLNFTVLRLLGFWALNNEGDKLKNRIYLIYRWFGVAGYVSVSCVTTNRSLFCHG